MTITIKFVDIVRGTLDLRTGNESWIGVSPDASAYHLVSPVDTQLAKGVLACNRPTDGTPFGGYSKWVYFRIPPFDNRLQDSGKARMEHAMEFSKALITKLTNYGIKSEIAWRDAYREGQPPSPGPVSNGEIFYCSSCSKKWHRLFECLEDPDLVFSIYRPCVSDFFKGSYLFRHRCNGFLEIPASFFFHKRPLGKNLANLKGCPGHCYYENINTKCLALCEGSAYRRLAWKLFEKRQNKKTGQCQ